MLLLFLLIEFFNLFQIYYFFYYLRYYSTLTLIIYINFSMCCGLFYTIYDNIKCNTRLNYQFSEYYRILLDSFIHGLYFAIVMPFLLLLYYYRIGVLTYEYIISR